MASVKQNAVHKPVANEETQRILAEETSAKDYANNMFRDGYNRVAHITNGRAYDAAAHEADVKDEALLYGDAEKAEMLLYSNLDATGDQSPSSLLAMKQDTSRSRDGTDASGSLDEDGGTLGGTTQEVDDLEATAMPVDKIPHMKD